MNSNRLDLNQMESFRLLDAPQSTPTQFLDQFYRTHGSAGQPLPRSLMTMQSIKPILSRFYILQWLPDRQEYFIRLWSSGARDAISMELQGSMLSDLPPQAYSKYRPLLDRVRESCAPLYVLNREVELGRYYLEGEICYVPLSFDDPAICDGVAGAFEMIAAPATDPLLPADSA